MRDRGVVVLGKVESGTAKIGDKVAIMASNVPCQIVSISNGKNQSVRYAKPGENVQIRLSGFEDEGIVNKGDVLCTRENLVPTSELFETEIEVLQLLEYKPILSKGYQCIMHIHTAAMDATVKDIVTAWETQESGEVLTKHRPQFTRSGAKIIARISTRIPIPLEKFDNIEQMGRFTLRDESRTIALGKILKYKPAKVTLYEETKVEEKRVDKTITEKDASKELVFNMETGETMTQVARRAKGTMDAVEEGEDGEDDEEEGKPPGVT